MALYKRAFLNGCKKVILLSGCCIPVKTFPAIYSYLTNDDSSYLAYQPHLAKTENERKTLESSLGRFLNNSYRSSDFARNIDITHWFYNETWTILNRYHAELILEHSWLLDQFRRMNCYAYDENFPSYVLSLTGELKNVINKRTTFTNWQESSGDKSKRHPKNYESISSSDLEAFKPFLFARKFSCISDIAKQLPLDSMIYTSWKNMLMLPKANLLQLGFHLWHYNLNSKQLLHWHGVDIPWLAQLPRTQRSTNGGFYTNPRY